MTTANNGFDIEIKEALQNNVSSVTYCNTKNTHTMKAFIDLDIIPKLHSALKRHSSIKINLRM